MAADFHVWGKVNQVGPQEFHVLVSAIPVDASANTAIVRARIAGSLVLAEAYRDELIREVGLQLVGRGDRVLDVVDS